MQDVTFHSSALNRDIEYRVILPAVVPAGTKLAAVYLLHGNGGGYRDWSNYSDVARFAAHDLILVMPEGNNSYYVNAWDPPQDRFEDFITQDLIADAESKFPIAAGRANRAIVGISMGGFGAMVLSLKHPELYVFAGGLSSAIDVPSRPLSVKRIGQYWEHRKIFGPWGSQTRHDSDPYVIAKNVHPQRAPYLFLSCGEQEGLLPANKRFATVLHMRGFEYEFHAGPGGHDWNQWNRGLPELFHTLQRRIVDHGH
jgi:S-formylglutathione hydrolase FrmB